MDWTVIRDYYAQLLATAQRDGITQKMVAARGGLSGANLISKLLKNEQLGPSVETFVRAVVGLGLSPSAFFAALERTQAGSTPPGGPAHVAAAVSLDHPIALTVIELAEVHTQIRVDFDRTMSDLRAQLDALARQQKDNPVATRVAEDRPLSARPPRVRTTRRRRDRRIA